MTVVEFNLSELEAEQHRRREGKTLADEAQDLAGDLRQFVRRAWPVVWPNTAFVDGWHIDAICDHLEAVTAGDIRRLQVWVPPGTMKSTTVSILWPVWEWARRPELRYITASYAQPLATRFAVKSRDLLRSSWFQRRWPHVELKRDHDLKQSYANTEGGERAATSPGGEGTGIHGDRIIIDDPINALEITSDAALEQVVEWHDGTIATRFTDPRRSAEVIIMQRLSERDLAGHVLGQEDWTVLCLPEEYEARHPYVTPPKRKLASGRTVEGDRRTVDGELLWEERVGPDEHAARLVKLGSFRAAGQLQQRPSAREGAILRRAYWRWFPPTWVDDDQIGLLPRFDGVVQSWDTAFKDRTHNDFVAGGVWGQAGADLYLLRLTVDHLSLSATKAAIRESTGWAADRWPGVGQRVLVEKSANGVEIIAELRRELRGVIPVSASTSKVARAEAAEPALEAGNVWLPGVRDPESPSGYDSTLTPAFAQGLVEECAAFPNGQHDDQVDMLTQAVNYVRRRGKVGGSVVGPRLGRPVRAGHLDGRRVQAGSLSG